MTVANANCAVGQTEIPMVFGGMLALCFSTTLIGTRTITESHMYSACRPHHEFGRLCLFSRTLTPLLYVAFGNRVPVVFSSSPWVTFLLHITPTLAQTIETYFFDFLA